MMKLSSCIRSNDHGEQFVKSLLLLAASNEEGFDSSNVNSFGENGGQSDCYCAVGVNLIDEIRSTTSLL
jgi:hypothetical protein